MSADDCDVIVLGVGAMGSAACYHLAKRGVSVIGLDQFDIPNTLGAHHGNSRVIRIAYQEHADYVPLLQRAYEIWEQAEQEWQQRLLYLTGALYLGMPEDPFVSGSIEVAKAHRLPHEVLNRKQISARFPQFHVPDEFIGFFESRAGLVVPERAVVAFATLAERHGATILANQRVRRWESNTHGVAVQTQHRTYRAKNLVICGGAWSNTLLTHADANGQHIGVELNVTRQILGWVTPKKTEQFSEGKFPTFAISCPDGSIHYGFPLIEEIPGPGLKIAHHWYDRQTTPETINREPEPGDEADFRGAVAKYLPDANGPLAAIRICMYTNSPDLHFIIDHHPNYKNVTIACGFSGHGFKFSAVVGEVLADLTLEAKTRHPIDFLSLKRFQS